MPKQFTGTGHTCGYTLPNHYWDLHHAQTIQWHWPYKFVHFTNHTPCPTIKWHTRPYMWVHTHCTHGTCGVLHCLLFCDQTRPNLRISLVGYHCAIEFPCGVPLFYCCKYPTTYGVRVHHTQPLVGLHHAQQLNGTHCHTCGYTSPNH